ncbi:Cysteine-rich RLK (RECEPTOR-like protein kinase) 8 [Hibiscus syriacus]|uniref:Cysteine-rich RLK (RECEPTOR-like protein kinase) 8 n=1 Tax=Hibiscus syriacus TaxID=106335 RepID=A0A6A3A150_HIBSY|nr:Cysteine-rich RLK (RECEPTOR-like protein kinase) 8 [Hibiscus syriacus]
MGGRASIPGGAYASFPILITPILLSPSISVTPTMPTTNTASSFTLLIEFAADSGDLGLGRPEMSRHALSSGLVSCGPHSSTRDSHLQKYRLYLKRVQGLSGGSGGGANGGSGGAGLEVSADPATDRLFASSPVPPHFLHPGSRANSEHFLPFVPVPALQRHHHHQQQQMVAAAEGHPHLQQTQQPMHRIGGTTVHNQAPSSYAEDLESANGNGGRMVLTLFPTGGD